MRNESAGGGTQVLKALVENLSGDDENLMAAFRAMVQKALRSETAMPTKREWLKAIEEGVLKEIFDGELLYDLISGTEQFRRIPQVLMETRRLFYGA